MSRSWTQKWTMALLLCALTATATATPEEPVGAQHGMVVTAQHIATDVGVQILKGGGNAIDAAVAVAYALSVVYPAAGNLGGGGFMTIRLANGKTTFLDFREKAPLAASRDMYLDAHGEPVPNLSTSGYLSVGVPGTVSGLEFARTSYGTKTAGELTAPAIALAEQGFVLDDGDVAMLRIGARAFRADPASAAIFLNQGMPFKPGERLVQTDLAATLRAIAQRGADGFYKGPVAQALVAASTAGNGILSQQDLDEYTTRELSPIECDYRGFHIVSAPPPSSGGVVLCEMLNIVEGYPLHELGFHSPQAVHYQIEAMRHAYADRNALLGDPAFVDNPTAKLLDKSYAAQIRASISPARAGVSTEILAGSPAHEGTHTTHYSIIDEQGNAVSVTYTLNNWFGARVVAAGTGVLLNDEMDDFTSKLGVPNMSRLIQGSANAIAPGKRPLSSMTPTIVTRGGQPVMVLGTPGGSRITTVVFLTLLNVIDYGMNLQEAVNAPRFHQQWEPETTSVENGGLSVATIETLQRMGQRFTFTDPTNHVDAILVGGPSLGSPPVGMSRFYGANDPRRDTGSAAGY